MASASMISAAAGVSPAAITALVAAPASATVAEGGEQRGDPLRAAQQAYRHLCGNAERALRADEHPDQVVAGSLRGVAGADPHQFAFGRADL